jgi:hypothetical protein
MNTILSILCAMPGTLAEVHRRAAAILGVVEPFESLERAEAHRAFWRPERVRVVLLAESHVFTSARDLERRVVRLPGAPAGIPTGFVRLVYCLGYGEDRILDRPIVDPPNQGTWQYWKVFFSCVYGVPRGGDFAPILATRTPDHVRLANKLDVLTRLRDAGVWLLDASPVALYAPGGQKAAAIDRCIEIGYDVHVGEQVAVATPSHIVCIGIGVGRVLGSRLAATGARVTVLPQPNARLSGSGQIDTLGMYRTVVEAARSQ